jgi:hypothetical protein
MTRYAIRGVACLIFVSVGRAVVWGRPYGVVDDAIAVVVATIVGLWKGRTRRRGAYDVVEIGRAIEGAMRETRALADLAALPDDCEALLGKTVTVVVDTVASFGSAWVDRRCCIIAVMPEHR